MEYWAGLIVLVWLKGRHFLSTDLSSSVPSSLHDPMTDCIQAGQCKRASELLTHLGILCDMSAQSIAHTLIDG